MNRPVSTQRIIATYRSISEDYICSLIDKVLPVFQNQMQMICYHIIEREETDPSNIFINPIFKEAYTVVKLVVFQFQKSIQSGDRCKWKFEKKGKKETGLESTQHCEDCYKRNLSLLLNPVS